MSKITYWHRWNSALNAYEEKRCVDSVPSDPTWERGHKPKTEEQRTHLSQKLKGREMSPEWRAKMSASARGRAKSPEHRAAMSAALKAYHKNLKDSNNGTT